MILPVTARSVEKPWCSHNLIKIIANINFMKWQQKKIKQKTGK